MFDVIQNNATQPAPSVVNSVGIKSVQAEPASSTRNESREPAPANEVREASKTEGEKEKVVSEDFLKDLQAEIESLHNVGLKFVKHDTSGKTMIRIVNKDTGSTIREIPSEKLLDLAAKLDEMLGILFDKTV
jgi:flagellar protein FlaG